MTADQEDADVLKRLAALARQRRVDLDMTKMAVAHTAGVSVNTYMKLEEGRPVRDATYSKIEAVFGWGAGSCRAILEGAPEPLEVARESGDAAIVRIHEGDFRQAITSAIVAVSETLTAPEIREVSRRVVEELKRRGLLEN